MQETFLRRRLRSFVFASRGIVSVVRTQQNAWVHASATGVVVAAGFALNVSRTEWTLLVLAMVAVWSAEALNTAVEALGDAVSRDHHPHVARAKDVAAGAVLIAAIGAVVVGGLVFVPRLLRMAQLAP